jgi:Zn-dependent protease/CBS domain-containing protein
MNNGWRLGRIGGIEIRVDPSLGLLAALITFDLWQVFTDSAVISNVLALGLAFAGAVLFIGSILTHELSHALVLRLHNVPVSHIRLFVFGGTAFHADQIKRPLAEFLTSVVGPLSSGALGFLFLLIYRARPPIVFTPVFYLFFFLGATNVFLAIFNLLPGLPLDGGRVFHSALWKLSRSRERATTIAGRAGQGIGLLLIGLGVFLFVRSQDIREVWLALIGWFVYQGASAELSGARRQRVLRSTRVRDVMTAPPPAIPADLSIGQALDSFLTGHDGEAFPVMEDGRVVGFVSSGSVAGRPLDGRVRDAVVEQSGVIQAIPDETLADLRERLSTETWVAVLVVDGGRVVGVIEQQNVTGSGRRWSG